MANLSHGLVKNARSLRLPDFIIGGASASGTAWLYQALKRHPQLHLAGPATPEPKFFLVDEVYERGLGFYSDAWFSDAPASTRAGEKSTNYLESAAAARRMKQDVPHVRLVFLLRRAGQSAPYSNYLWSCKNGLEKENFADASRSRRRRKPPCRLLGSTLGRMPTSLAGFMRDCLQAYFEAFPRSQILCLTFDDLRQRPGWLAAENSSLSRRRAASGRCREPGRSQPG